MGIVDKVMGGLRDKEAREAIHNENQNRHETGPEALALGKPSEVIVDDRIGGTHTRNVLDAVTHETVKRHAHHEVTPIVNREREETEIHQKIQPIVDNQEHHTHHQHVAPHVSRHVQEDITEDHAVKYRQQATHRDEQLVGEQTHSTSVNSPIIREHVNRHIIEEIQPVIQRQTQRVEHHHTTQQINETHVKAPIVHSVVTNAAITMEEFAGKAASLSLHGHNGDSSNLGRSGTTSTSGTHHHGGSRGVGSGLSNDNSTGLRNDNSTGLRNSVGSNSSSNQYSGNNQGVSSHTGDSNNGKFGTIVNNPTAVDGDRVSTGQSLSEKAKNAVGLGSHNERRA